MHIESEFQEFGDSSQVRAQQCSIVMFIYAWHQPNNEYDAWLIAAISDWRRAPYIRADSRFATSQWETSLQSNAVSHWLGTNQESALLFALWTPGWCNRWIISNWCYRKAITSGCVIDYPESKVHGANMDAHLGPVGPIWAPCWPHEPCYQGTYPHSMSNTCIRTSHTASCIWICYIAHLSRVHDKWHTPRRCLLFHYSVNTMPNTACAWTNWLYFPWY